MSKAVILGPTPSADTTIGVLAAVLISDVLALVTPVEFFSRKCLRVSFTSTGSFSRLPLFRIVLWP